MARTSLAPLTDPVANTVRELRTSPADVAAVTGAGLLAYYVFGPSNTIALISGIALGAVAIGFYQHHLTPQHDERAASRPRRSR